MADPEHLEILQKGYRAWNRWRLQNTAIKPNLRRANLQNADLSYYNLNCANLVWAQLQNADLSYADLTCANLSRALLDRTNFSHADLGNAILSDCDFRTSFLEEAHFEMTIHNRGTHFSKSE